MTKSETKPKLKPVVCDITAIGTGQGKTLFANRLAAHLAECSYRVYIFRVESERVDYEAHDGITLINTEKFSHAQNTSGGLAGIMSPLLTMLEKLQDGDAIVIDWAGGTTVHRANLMLAIGFDQFVREGNVTSWSVHLVTGDIRRIRETERLIKLTKEEMPSSKRLLVFNEVLGPFSELVDGPVGDALRQLHTEHGTSPKLTMPRIQGEAWKCLAPLKKDLLTILEANAFEVAEKLDVNRFIAQAHLTHMATWYLSTRDELDRVMPFPTARTSDPQ